MPILSFLFVALLIVLHLLPGAFNALTFLRSGVFELELWRLITAVLVHYNWEHLIRDCAAFLCFGPIVELRLGRFRFLGYIAVVSLLTSLAYLAFRPQIEFLFGISGVVSGFFGVLLAQDLPRTWRTKSFKLFSLELVLVIGFIAKLGFETFFQESFFYRSQIGAAPLAHFVGFMTGLGAGYFSESRLKGIPKIVIASAVVGAIVWISAVLFWPTPAI